VCAGTLAAQDEPAVVAQNQQREEDRDTEKDRARSQLYGAADVSECFGAASRRAPKDARRDRVRRQCGHCDQAELEEDDGRSREELLQCGRRRSHATILPRQVAPGADFKR
jgi:hypothetical protein